MILERNESHLERSETLLERKDMHLTRNETRNGNLHLSGTVVNIVMLLYLVQPESSRIFCCKIYKRIGVVFRWFYFPGVLR